MVIVVMQKTVLINSVGFMVSGMRRRSRRTFPRSDVTQCPRDCPPQAPPPSPSRLPAALPAALDKETLLRGAGSVRPVSTSRSIMAGGGRMTPEKIRWNWHTS